MVYLLKKFKETNIWKYIVLIIVKPMYEFFWQYVINFKGKIFYFMWNFKKHEYYDLKGNNKVVLEQEQKITNLCKEILNFANDEFIEKEKNKILLGDTGTDKPTKSAFRTKEKNFSKQFLRELPKVLQMKIINFACSEKMVTTASKYLKVFPILASVKVSLNIPREGEKERGAMLWHKDDLGYKSIDFVAFVTDVDDDNGPFYTLKKKNPLGVFYKLKDIIKNPKPGERNKVDLKIFSNKYSEDEVLTFKGSSGTAMFVDSMSNYHRGGFCKSKHRIKLRFEYTTVESIIIDKRKPYKEFYEYIKSEYKKNYSNIFLNFLLFKRSSIIEKLKISELSMAFFRLMHYKN